MKRIGIFVLLIMVNFGTSHAQSYFDQSTYFKQEIEGIWLVDDMLTNFVKTESYQKEKLWDGINQLAISSKREISLNSYDINVMQHELQMKVNMLTTINDMHLVDIDSYNIIFSYCKNEITKDDANIRIIENRTKIRDLHNILNKQLKEYSNEMNGYAKGVKEVK